MNYYNFGLGMLEQTLFPPKQSDFVFSTGVFNYKLQMIYTQLFVHAQLCQVAIAIMTHCSH